MRSYRDELLKLYKVNYVDINDKSFKESYFNKLLRVIEKRSIEKVNFYEIEDLSFANKPKLIKKRYPTLYSIVPMFVTSRVQFKSDISEMKKPKMASFYIKQREKIFYLQVLANLLAVNGALTKKIEKKYLKILKYLK